MFRQYFKFAEMKNSRSHLEKDQNFDFSNVMDQSAGIFIRPHVYIIS